MAKTNKYVHFNTRAAFDKKCPNPSAAEGNEFYYYTVFIKDTGEIYTHGKFYGQNYFELTYAEIKDLRDNGKLIPGSKYRMIDYVATYPQKSDLIKTDIQFDLVLTATSTNTFDNRCNAVHHMGLNDRNLSMWQVWYDLDNKYWSDTTEVTAFDSGDCSFTQSFTDEIRSGGLTSDGWIFNNVFSNEDYVASKNDTFVDYGYDTDPFGHRILVLYKTEEGYDEPDYDDKYIYWGYNEEYRSAMFRVIDGEYTYDSPESKYILIDGDSDSFINGTPNGEIVISANGRGTIYRLIDEFNNDLPYDFISISTNIKGRNNRVLPSDDNSLCIHSIEGVNNVIGGMSYCVILGNENVVGKYSTNIYIKGDCNVIGDHCQNIHLGHQKSTWSGIATGMTIGSYCNTITISSFCSHSVFGSNCNHITIAQTHNCIFGAGCSHLNFPINYLENCKFGSGCHHLYCWANVEEPVSCELLRINFDANCVNIAIYTQHDVYNLHITASCSSNETQTPEMIFSGRTQPDESTDFIAMRNSDGEIKVFNPADLIA